MIRAILAHDARWGIGKGGKLPWFSNSGDLQWFKECTNGGVVVMGRKTWESLPLKPLPGRLNYVVSSNPNIEEGYHGRIDDHNNLGDEMLFTKRLQLAPELDIWIIGGAQLVESCLPMIHELWLNNVGGDHACDVFLPKQKITELFRPHESETRNFGTITKWIRI